MVKNKVRKHVEKHIGLFKKIFEWTLNHVFWTTIIFYMFITIPSLISSKLAPISVIFGAVLVVYIVSYIVYRLKNNIEKLLHHEITNKQLISGYLSIVFFSVFLFTIIYLLSTLWGVGYLKYGTCIDNGPVNAFSIANDPLHITKITHYAYFSSITFFTVGYGDICPMGWSKLIAVFNALLGNIFTVLIVSLAIINYSANRRNGK